MSPLQWEQQGFTQPGVIHLYSTNKEVQDHNMKELLLCGKPILHINASNSSARARGMSSDRFNGLQNSLYLSIDATVVLTSNLWPEMGLSNGSTGSVKAIEFRNVQVSEAQQIEPWDDDRLPYCVWVDFSEQYRGPPFFLKSMKPTRHLSQNGDGFQFFHLLPQSTFGSKGRLTILH